MGIIYIANISKYIKVLLQGNTSVGKNECIIFTSKSLKTFCTWIWINHFKIIRGNTKLFHLTFDLLNALDTKTNLNKTEEQN